MQILLLKVVEKSDFVKLSLKLQQKEEHVELAYSTRSVLQVYQEDCLQDTWCIDYMHKLFFGLKM